MPLVEPEMSLAATEPPSEANGTFAVSHARRPNMLKLWVYDLLDLVFVFSPTDALPLTRSAKMLMMAQAAISVVTLTGIAGAAINVLAGNR